MNKFTTVLALAASFIPSSLLARTGASNADQHRFTARGVTYTYTVAPDARGHQVIQGHTQDGAAFRLIVDGDRVDGISGGQQVSFRTRPAQGTQLAAR